MVSPLRPPGVSLPDEHRVSPEFQALLRSERVNGRLRRALEERARADESGSGRVLPPAELDMLRAVLRRVLPRPIPGVDLAARIDARLASGEGDGWRYDLLPPDAEAYGQALRTLDAQARQAHGRGLADLGDEAIDALLHDVQAGSAGESDEDGPRPDALLRWFEDLRADAVRIYMAQPSTLDRIGFSGVGAGGDDVLSGFSRFGMGVEEDWEPRAYGEGARS